MTHQLSDVQRHMQKKLSDVLQAASARPYRVAVNADGAFAGMRCLIKTGRLEAFGPRQLGYPHIRSEEFEPTALLLAHAANQIEGLVEALQAMLDDETCASNKARAALATATTIDL